MRRSRSLLSHLSFGRGAKLSCQPLEPRNVPANFLVTSLADSGTGSLRAALSTANGNGTADLIEFQPGLTGVITLTSSSLFVSEPVTIAGPGSSDLSISGNKTFRVLDCQGAPTSTAISLSGLTLTNGNVNGTGGGINIGDEQLTLTNCVVTGNSATARGGGIYVGLTAGTLTMQACTLSDNFSGTDGGGFCVRQNSPVIIRDSSITGNSCSNVGGGFRFYVAGSLLLENSTVSGNTSSSTGGGMFLPANTNPNGLVIRNSTIAGNTAGESGGAIRLLGFSTLLIQNSTITGNKATTGSGGGIAPTYHSCSVIIENSIISGNINSIAPDIAGYSASTFKAKFSAIGSSTGFPFTDQGGNLPFMTDLKLGSLGPNGGPTQTIALMADSPCINAGSNLANLVYDQRGPGFYRVIGKTADIGAFEFQNLSAVVLSVKVNDGSTQRSMVTSLTVNFDRPVSTNPSSFQLVRISDGAPVALSATPTGTSVTLNFTGGPVEFGSLADGKYMLTAIAAEINGGNLDGNGDKTPGDNYQFMTHRLFGDGNGDLKVDAADFAMFRSVYGTAGPSIFNFNNDGSTNSTDFAEFRKRFGITLP